MRIKKVSESILPEGHVIDSLKVGSSTNAPSIDAVNEALNGVVLYDNSTGSNGTFTLSDSVNNYKYLDIYYGWYQNGSFTREIECKRIYANSVCVNLSSIQVGSNYWQLSRLRFDISGNTFTKNSASYLIDSPSSYSQETFTRVVKVIGYK